MLCVLVNDFVCPRLDQPHTGSLSCQDVLLVGLDGRRRVGGVSVVKVVVRRVHHEGHVVQLPRQVLLGPDDVSGGVEALGRVGTVGRWQEPSDNAALLAILVGKEASQLGIVDASRLPIDHGYDVTSREVLAPMEHPIGGHGFGNCCWSLRGLKYRPERVVIY